MILHVALVVASVVSRPTLKPVVHKFYDKTAKLELGLGTAAASSDMAQTCRNLANGGHENWMFQSCRSNLLLTAGLLGAQEGLAFALHKMGHHKLERLPRLFSLQGNIRGLIYSKQHGAW